MMDQFIGAALQLGVFVAILLIKYDEKEPPETGMVVGAYCMGFFLQWLYLVAASLGKGV